MRHSLRRRRSAKKMYGNKWCRVGAVMVLVAMLLGAIGSGAARAVDGGRLDSMADAQISGEAPNDLLGSSVAIVGDVNGDGFADVVSGAPANGGTDAGAAYLMLGGASGWGLHRLANQAPFIKFTGTSAGDRAGTSVGAAGDVNSDGFDDFLVGAPNRDDGLGANQGVTYLILGSASPSSANLSTAVKYSGVAAGDQAGTSVSAAGDVDGDGFDDFLTGAPNRNDGAGANQGVAYLILGSAAPAASNLSTHIAYSGEGAGDLAGTSVSLSGDAESDGLSDYLVGAPGNNASRGAAYVFDGNASPTAGTLGTAATFSFEVTGEAAGDQLGGSVAGPGDVNGDGVNDTLVGAKLNGAGAGAAYLILNRPGAVAAGSTTGILTSAALAAIKYSGEAGSDNAGSSLAAAGDVDGDGFDDFLVGATLEGTSDKGAAYLVLGSGNLVAASLSTAVKYPGQLTNDQAGNALAGGRDVNGDGTADMLIGGFHNDIVFSEGGAAYLIFGDEPTVTNPAHRQRRNMAGTAAANNFPVLFEPAGLRVDFNAAVFREGDVSVRRSAFSLCTHDRRQPMPIWTIDSTKFGGGGTAVIRFKYNNDQIAGMTEGSLKLWTRSAGQPCSAWALVGGSAVDATHNFVSATVGDFGQFTISDSQPPTAVEVQSFNPLRSGESVFAAIGFALLVIGAVVGQRYRRRRSHNAV